ncbi:MAG: AarF/UbiB family protein [Actinomycetota bacterium]|jgi:predicted unusual protein kinase regulating ubiquinone biosynthesis (AarF/ABC1/UbiB family)|nr:AarF/UbiB family protein [Actinomycetota bacterium]
MSEPEAAVDLRRLSPRDARRLVDIVLTLARHGAFVVVRRGPFLVLRPRRQAPRAVAVALRRSFTDLGPTFVKFGQLIASSPGLFPEVLSNEFRRLLDRLPAEPPTRVRAVIEGELGAPVGDLFATFDDTPLAAASIAQVHAATLPDGTRVAVKVRRPHLGARIERDLRLLRLLAAVLQHAGAVGEIANPVAVVEDFATTLRSELDFRNEAAFMTDFARNLRAFGDNDRVAVPAPVEAMVSPRVLVMTFVDGTPVDDIETLGQTGHDLEDVLRVGVRAWVEAALVHGLFHGDVHAGNLFVTPDGGVAFLDFGIVGHLDDHTRGVLRRLLPAVVEGDYQRAVRAVFELGAVRRPTDDLPGAAEELESLVQPLLTARLSDISYGEILGHVLRVATRYSVRLPRELVLVVKQLLYFERYAKRLAPDYQILADPGILAHLFGPASSS